MRVGVALLVLALTGCAESVPVAPPDLRYGEDICALCGMIITDDRYAAALVRQDPAGRREARAFDDVGCLLRDESPAPAHAVAGRWVRDFRADRWLDAGAAVYLQSRHLHSPMAFGLAACESREAAEALATEFPGELLDFDTATRRSEANTLILPPEPPREVPAPPVAQDTP